MPKQNDNPIVPPDLPVDAPVAEEAPVIPDLPTTKTLDGQVPPELDGKNPGNPGIAVGPSDAEMRAAQRKEFGD